MPIDPRPDEVREGQQPRPKRGVLGAPDDSLIQPQGLRQARAAGIDVPPAAAQWQELHPELYEQTPNRPAVLTRSVAPEAGRGMHAEEFVILHSQLGPFEGGQVVSREELLKVAAGAPSKDRPEGDMEATARDGLRRYLEGGGVRPASESERGRRRVTLPRRGQATAPRDSMEEEVRGRDAEIQRLRASLAHAQEKARQAEARGVAPAEAPQMEPQERTEMRAALQQHEDRHAALRKELEAKNAEIEGLRAYIQQHEGAQGEEQPKKGRRG
jgi:hypothetical protein